MAAPLIISISGLRGIIGESLVPQVAIEYGMAFGTYLKRNHTGDVKPKVCIGRDGRPSGPMVAAGVSAGLMAAGCDAVDLGIVTTPGGALMIGELDCDGGVIITASHNPVPYNGIKLLSSTGVAFDAVKVKSIQKLYFDKEFDLQDSLNVGRSSVDETTHDVHVGKVLELCDPKLIASKKFKVVLDSINASGCIGTAKLLKALGCEFVHLNSEPTGIFAHTPEPTEENLRELGPKITENAANIGFAQDPDADRLVIIDENGRYIGEEYTLALVVKYMLSKKKGPVAANLSTSRMVDDIAAAAGCKVIRTAVGEAHVANEMIKSKCVAGGEGNGGVIETRIVPVRNSFAGIALVLQLMAETGKTISQLVNEIQ